MCRECVCTSDHMYCTRTYTGLAYAGDTAFLSVYIRAMCGSHSVDTATTTIAYSVQRYTTTFAHTHLHVLCLFMPLHARQCVELLVFIEQRPQVSGRAGFAL